jgi:hypothetical protein
MSVSNAMEAVLSKLRHELATVLPPEQIGFCSPAEVEDNISLGLFLYGVERDGRANVESFMADANMRIGPPLPVALHLLITSYLGKRSGLIEDYRLLEMVMAALSDGAKLTVRSLLQPSRYELPSILLAAVEPDEMSKIWQFPNVPYRLSLCYVVRPVLVPSQLVASVSRVGATDFDTAESEPNR